MKINVLKSFAVVAMMALASCTTEVVESTESGGQTLSQGENVIKISLSNTMGTRAARPMGSSKAENNVNRIAFKFLMQDDQTEFQGVELLGVYDDNDVIVDDYEVSNGVLVLPEEYDGSEINVKFDNLEPGSYKIIACGYNYTSGTDEEDKFPYDIQPAGENYLLKCEDLSNGVQEIFAGCNSNAPFVVVNKYGKFTEPPVIELTRQVAGLIAYFKEAPVYVRNKKVSKITVSSKADVKGFYIPGTGDYNGIGDAEYSWVATKWINYLTFDMGKAKNYSNPSSYFYDFDDSYILADEMTEIDGLVCDANTLFGSCFLLSFPAYYDFSSSAPKCATLNICYWADGDDTEPILSVPLRSGGSSSDALSTNSYQYGIKTNNLYSIGTKKTVDNTDDEDEPTSLDESTGYENAEVSIDSEWKTTHELIK